MERLTLKPQLVKLTFVMKLHRFMAVGCAQEDFSISSTLWLSLPLPEAPVYIHASCSSASMKLNIRGVRGLNDASRPTRVLPTAKALNAS